MARRTVNFDSSFVDLGRINVACYDAVSSQRRYSIKLSLKQTEVVFHVHSGCTF